MEVLVGVGWVGLGAGSTAEGCRDRKGHWRRSPRPAGPPPPARVFSGPGDRLLPNLSDNLESPLLCPSPGFLLEAQTPQGDMAHWDPVQTPFVGVNLSGDVIQMSLAPGVKKNSLTSDYHLNINLGRGSEQSPQPGVQGKWGVRATRCAWKYPGSSDQQFLNLASPDLTLHLGQCRALQVWKSPPNALPQPSLQQVCPANSSS